MVDAANKAKPPRPSWMPDLESGRVYRTAEFGQWTSAPGKLVLRLEKSGLLRRLGHGYYMCAERHKFGWKRADNFELLRAILSDDNFIVTGSDQWNSLELGTLAVLPFPIVYNNQLTQERTLDGRRFYFQRRKHPKEPSREWYVIDLFDNASLAQASLVDLERQLIGAIRQGKFDPKALVRCAVDYGSRETQAHIFNALRSTASVETENVQEDGSID